MPPVPEIEPVETTLVHDEGVDLDAPAVVRRAVRAVVLRGRDVLLLETGGGALKFPGGGVEAGETDEAALAREVAEELGMVLEELRGDLGEVREVARAHEDDPHDLFTMVSRYLLCSVRAGSGRQSLSPGERALGLAPVWVDVAEAVARNQAALAEGPRFVRRELTLLRALEAALDRSRHPRRGETSSR